VSGDLQSLGVGGIIAFLLVREVLGFLKAKKSNGHSGDRSVEFWESTIRRLMNEALAQNLTLSEMCSEIEEIRKDTTAIRGDMHHLIDKVQALVLAVRIRLGLGVE